MEFELPQEELFFNIAQTFYLDKAFFKGAEEVGLTKVNLYFKCKPAKINNKSGINSPGVTMYLCATNNEIPDISKIVKQGIVRKEYDEITPSADASTPTTFNFEEPIEVDTGFSYAIVIAYDGDEYFGLWASKEGQTLVGSNNKTAGPAGQYIGKYYEYSSVMSVNNSANMADRLTPLNDTDIKFDVYCAKYTGYSNTVTTNTVTGQTYNVPSGTITHVLPSQRYEFFIFDSAATGDLTRLDGDDYVFQNTVLQVGTLSVNANSVIVNGSANVNFNTLYDLTSNTEQYLIVYINDVTEKYMVRKIVSVESNTQLIIDTPSKVTNTAARFMRSPVGLKFIKDRSRSFGKKKDFLALRQSNANSSLRFVNNTVEDVTIVAGGTSYSNGDVITITAVTNNSMNAVATLTTNSTGGITNLTFSNNGAGINTSPLYVFANSSNGTSTGSAANLTFSVGATLLTEKVDTKLANVTLINYDFHGHRWAGDVGANKGTSFTSKHRWKYYHTGNTYDVNIHSEKNEKLLKKLQKNNLPTKNAPLMVSWSYRVLQTGNNDQDDSSVEIVIDSNSWFTCPKVDSPDLYIYKNIINNDYTNEHTRYGNALSKHISTKLNFEEGRFAEDVIVNIRALRPANTDIKIYAKLHNSNDPEAFDDKDWTLLECKSGANSYTSSVNEDDYIEMSFGPYNSPNTTFISNGVVTTVLSNNQITGSGTSFNTDFANNDLVKVYSPLFVENYMIAVVNNVVNSSSIELKTTVSNNSMVGSGFKIAKLGYKHQAFNYGLNDNVLRYYNSLMAEYDTYDTFAMKIVLLSDFPSIVPKIDDCRIIGTSS